MHEKKKETRMLFIRIMKSSGKGVVHPGDSCILQAIYRCTYHQDALIKEDRTIVLSPKKVKDYLFFISLRISSLIFLLSMLLCTRSPKAAMNREEM